MLKSRYFRVCYFDKNMLQVKFEIEVASIAKYIE